MNRRQSFEVPGLEHENPIPMTCRIGQIVMSSGIFPRDPATKKAPPEVDKQCALLFANIRRAIEASGGTTDDIIKVTVWVKDKSTKAHMNREWLAMFPDPHSRPARHTFAYQDLPGDVLMQCEIIAVISSMASTGGTT